MNSRLVADDAQLSSPAGRIACEIREPLLDVVDDLDGVGARLLADLQQHRRLAVDAGHACAPRPCRPRRAPTSRHAHRVAVHLAQHDVAELARVLDAAAGAHRDRLRALVDAAAGDVGVLRLQRARDVVDRQVVAAQPLGIQPHVDLALAAAEHQHLADAVGALEPPPQHLVGVLGDVADRLVGGHGDGEDRLRVGVLLLDRRLRDRARQQRQDAVDAVAHFLRGDVGVLLELEASRRPARCPRPSSS